MLKIIGAKGKIQSIEKFLKKMESYSQNHNLTIQAFDADVIYGKNHLISAVEHAIRAMERKTNTTNSLGMEILLYASGERQLKIAIPKMGVKKGDTNIVFVFTEGILSNQEINVILKQLSLIRDDSVLEGDINTLKKFGITEIEMNTVTKNKYGNLILEKVAMVDIIK
jgi:KEOPS complex subunit Cgi121